jgi:hypothetical protein
MSYIPHRLDCPVNGGSGGQGCSETSTATDSHGVNNSLSFNLLILSSFIQAIALLLHVYTHRYP